MEGAFITTPRRGGGGLGPGGGDAVTAPQRGCAPDPRPLRKVTRLHWTGSSHQARNSARFPSITPVRKPGQYNTLLLRRPKRSSPKFHKRASTKSWINSPPNQGSLQACAVISKSWVQSPHRGPFDQLRVHVRVAFCVSPVTAAVLQLARTPTSVRTRFNREILIRPPMALLIGSE